MLKGFWVAFKRMIHDAPVDDADVGASYARLCNTLEFYNKSAGEIDCDVSQNPGTGQPTRSW